MQETQVQSLGGEDPLEKENGKPTLVTNFHARGNSIDRGAWQATVHRVTKSQTRLKQLSMQTPLNLSPPLAGTMLGSVNQEG